MAIALLIKSTSTTTSDRTKTKLTQNDIGVSFVLSFYIPYLWGFFAVFACAVILRKN